MEEDKIIQKDLFTINHEVKRPNNSSQIPEDLSTEELKKYYKNDSYKRKKEVIRKELVRRGVEF